MQAVQLLAVCQRYLQCESQIFEEHQELMGFLRVNLHVASLGMHGNPGKSQSAARRVVKKLQSNMQRSSHAFEVLVREFLVEVLNPTQVNLQALSSRDHAFVTLHSSISCKLAFPSHRKQTWPSSTCGWKLGMSC